MCHPQRAVLDRGAVPREGRGRMGAGGTRRWPDSQSGMFAQNGQQRRGPTLGLPAAIKGIRRWEPLWPCLAWVVRRRPALRPADWPPKLAHPRSSLLGQMCCSGRAELAQTNRFWHPAVRCHDDVVASEGGMARLAVTLSRIPRSTLAKIKCGRTRRQWRPTRGCTCFGTTVIQLALPTAKIHPR